MLQFGRRVLRMGAEARPHAFPQRVRLRAPGHYALSAWFYSKRKEPLRLATYLIDDKEKSPLATRDVMPDWAGQWARATLAFSVPPPRTERRGPRFADVEIVLSDAAVKDPVDLFIDCVEVEPAYGINRGTALLGAAPQTVERGARLTLTGENLKPGMFVTFGDQRAGYARWLSPSSVSVAVPADLAPGPNTLALQPRHYIGGAHGRKVSLPNKVHVR